MKMLRLAILLTLCLCSLAQAKYPPAVQHEAQPYHRAVVRVDAGRGYGSGVLIAVDGEVGVVITCAHVIKEGPPYNVAYPGGGWSTPQVLATHTSLDVAALYVYVPPGIEPLPLSDYVPNPGWEVELCGYGGGRWCSTKTTVRDRVQSRLAVKTDIGLQHISIPGESGGPILVVENGEPRVAAVNWGGPTATEYYTKPMRYSQGCDSHQIRHWLSYAVAPRFPWVLGDEIEVKGGAE